MTLTATQTAARARYVTDCGLCGSDRLKLVLSLGASPPPCVMHPVSHRPLVEESYPLELLRCENCTLVQLSVVVDANVMFPPDFPYSSGNSRQLHHNFESLATKVQALTGGLHDRDLIVDIGANDGTLLSKFNGCRTLGVEPTDQADKIRGDYIKAGFDEELADWITGEYGQATVITACNVLAHIDDIGTVMRGIRKLLAPDGVLVVENHDVRSVLAGQWDMVYHEHLRYWSPHSFGRLLARHGLMCHEWHATSTHGGSFRMIAKNTLAGWMPKDEPQNWQRLQRRATDTRRLLRRELAACGPVIGIGAAARATTIINYVGLDVEDISMVCEVPGSDKIGKYIPGTEIPVVGEQVLFDSNKVGLLLSWHLEHLIVPRLAERGYTQPIIVPLPTRKYIRHGHPNSRA